MCVYDSTAANCRKCVYVRNSVWLVFQVFQCDEIYAFVCVVCELKSDRATGFYARDAKPILFALQYRTCGVADDTLSYDAIHTHI